MQRGITFDVSCFGLNASDQLDDDRYFIFYNQKSSPCRSIESLGPRGGDQEQYHIDLSTLPPNINKLVFAITIDGHGLMSQMVNGHLRILEQTNEIARFVFSGADFKDEKAIIVSEIYYKGVWRIASVGQGYNEGLRALLKHFGGEELTSGEQQSLPSLPIAVNKVISLEKRIEREAPHLMSLSKKLSVTLEKKKLQETIAKVAIVMDASGSMASAYRNGTVQAVLDRMVLVAARLDDDGLLETWFYASKHKRFPDISIGNIAGYLKNNIKGGFGTLVKGLGFGNNEPPVMQEVLEKYKLSRYPALVIFITDGGIYETKKIKNILIEWSSYPVFWQFVGLAGSNYGVLNEFDTLEGRKLDNAGFFQVDDLKKISDDELFNRLLDEFPFWLNEAKKLGII